MPTVRDSGYETDARFMARALDLARRADGCASPNPMVGCVLVKAGEIVAEGWHDGPGTPHAETAALAAAGEAARGAVAYVTLEPCNHWGRNPPCAGALIEAGVTEAVIALTDPNAVAAGGAARLREAGVAVRTGVLEREARALNARWLHAMAQQRPYVIAKIAASLDGRIAAANGESQWITGPDARDEGHKLRAGCHAVLAGADTVIADNPQLTARPGGVPAEDARQPVRVIMDSTGRIPLDARVCAPGLPARTILAATDAMSPLRREAFTEQGVEVLITPATPDARVDPHALLSALYAQGVSSVLIEGGASVHGAFFGAGVVDEVCAFLAPLVLGGEGRSAVSGRGAQTLAEAWRLEAARVEQIGADIMVRGRLALPTGREVPCSQAS